MQLFAWLCSVLSVIRLYSLVFAVVFPECLLCVNGVGDPSCCLLGCCWHSCCNAVVFVIAGMIVALIVVVCFIRSQTMLLAMLFVAIVAVRDRVHPCRLALAQTEHAEHSALISTSHVMLKLRVGDHYFALLQCSVQLFLVALFAYYIHFIIIVVDLSCC